MEVSHGQQFTGLEFRGRIQVGDIYKVAANMWIRIELCVGFRERTFMSWWQCHLGVWNSIVRVADTSETRKKRLVSVVVGEE